MKHHAPSGGHEAGGHHYIRLAVMAAGSFVAMYGLMYAMVDRFANVFPNLNQAYMAGLMTAPMVVIELLVMWSMYPNRKLNGALLVASAAILAVCWSAIRAQAAITDREFLKSMIPHHAGAILNVPADGPSRPGSRRVVQEIVSSQQREIDFMKNKLRQPVSSDLPVSSVSR